MSYSVASGNNTFVPSHEASGSLVDGYSRNVNDFAINRIMQRVPVKKSVFYYLNWYSQQGSRVKSANNAILPGAEFQWNDGHDAPSGLDNLEQFSYQIAETQRYAVPFALGQKAIDQADWNILAAHGGVVAQQMMTLRTIQTYNAVINSGATSATATSLGGAKFNAGTPSSPSAKPGLTKAALAINKATMGTVGIKDLCLWMNPNTAQGISPSQEITDNIKYQAGVTYVEKGAPTDAGNWGLPAYLYGFEVIVDTTTVNTNAKGASSDTGSYVIPDGTILMVSKAGGLQGVEGAMSWSSVMGFFYEEFTVEQKYDADNRRTLGRVVTDNTIIVPTQGVKSTYIITAAI